MIFGAVLESKVISVLVAGVGLICSEYSTPEQDVVAVIGTASAEPFITF